MGSVYQSVSVLVLVALKSEAKPIIRNLKLKQKKLGSNRYYTNEEVGLLITGIGYDIVEEQLFNVIKEISPLALLNVGICGSIDRKCDIGTIFYVNKVSCDKTKNVFYPDAIVNAKIPNASLITFTNPQMDYKRHSNRKYHYLVDMEGAILYRIFHKVYGPHKIQFLKIVSDHLSTTEFRSVSVKLLIESSLSYINEFNFQHL